jgi:hypothetical protein
MDHEREKNPIKHNFCGHGLTNFMLIFYLKMRKKYVNFFLPIITFLDHGLTNFAPTFKKKKKSFGENLF